MSMKTPGVYIKEVNAFPPSIVEVATAVPAFIGYTEKAEEKGQSLLNKPRRIGSMAEFERFFGGGPPISFDVSTTAVAGVEPVNIGGTPVYISQSSPHYRLHRGMRHFFQNGGGTCVIVSVGLYDDPAKGGKGIQQDPLTKGIDTLANEHESTMIVIPDAISLEDPACANVQNAMLMHCQSERQRNRFSILDVQHGDRALHGSDDPVVAFRTAILKTGADFGAAYYPYLDTSLIGEDELGLDNVAASGRTAISALVTVEQPAGQELAGMLDGAPASGADTKDAHKALYNGSPAYKTLMQEMRRQLSRVAPSAAMAGIYTLVDGTRGVWKAPANVGIAGVIAPAVQISHADQEDLNVTPQGKSVNAIRSFIGEGVMVWGARTLDGNSLDWRYINVRRTMIMIEQSCKLAAKQLVFEPNVANTWVTIKSMISNYLTTVWKRGGLAGAVPEDAFTVLCGLGETMAPEDILEGILKVTVLVAVSRPAEFIEITFQQQMQKS
jgi:phage tail sheath protein FI